MEDDARKLTKSDENFVIFLIKSNKIGGTKVTELCIWILFMVEDLMRAGATGCAL